MELEPVGTAPHSGSPVLVLDEASGSLQLARWSHQANAWTAELGDPLAICPTHWLPTPGDHSYSCESGGLASRLKSVSRYRLGGVAVAALLMALTIGMASLGTTRQLLNGYSPGVPDQRMPEGSQITSLGIQREHQRGDALALELASAREEAAKSEAQIQSLQAHAVRVQQSADATVADQKRLLHETTIRSAALERELTVARMEGQADILSANSAVQGAIARAKAAEAEVEWHRHALEREHQSREELARELASAQADSSTLRLAANLPRAQKLDAEENPADVAHELRTALASETKRADYLASALAAARDEIAEQPMLAQAASAEALNAVREEAQEQRTEAEAERTKSETLLGRDLASTRLENEALARDLTSAREEIAELKYLLGRAAQHQQDQNEAIVSRQTLERQVAAARSEKDSLVRAMETTRAKLVTLTQKAEEDERSFCDESRRADSLARDAESEKRERAGAEAKPNVAIAGMARQMRGAAAITAEHKNALDGALEQPAGLEVAAGSTHGQSMPTRSRSDEVPATVSDPIRDVPSDQVATPTAPVGTEGKAEQPLPAETKAQPSAEQASAQLAAQSTLSLADEERLIARAKALLGQADIGAARAVLHHIVNRGSPRGAFILAETYDPRILQTWRVQGIRGDSAIAQEMYRRAATAGLDQAKERLEKSR
jgi:hypothetical protein